MTVLGEIPEKNEWIHRSFAIHAVGVVIRGRGTYAAGDGPKQRINAPALFPVFPGPRFDYGPDRHTTWHELHVGGFGKEIEAWVSRGLLPIDGRVTGLDRTHDALRWLRSAIKENAADRSGNPLRVKPLAELALIELAESRTDTLSAPMSGHMLEVINYLQEHYTEPIDWERLARKFAMSYSLLRKKIRSQTGLPPNKYLTALRCRAAAEMLHATSDSIDQIGRAVGYDDPSVFSRTFTRTKGMPPRDYRQQRLG